MSKRRPRSQTSRVAGGGSDNAAWRCDADAKLAGLFQAALEEPIPDDMLRLVRMIGTPGAHSD